jgi:hypothetical protein
MGSGRLARRLARSDRFTVRRCAAVLAAVAGVLAVTLSLEVFPYRSFNHDEGVYLQQAAMLLDGRLVLEPPVDGALRPWFFVEDGGALYPKYAPVPAAMFAVGMALGDPVLALGGIAAACVGLTYALVAEAVDARTGLVAAALLVATPLFLVQSSVFLPYLPTLAWLLLFGWASLRADRTGSRRWAALAGLAVGVAFFARPYTAVLFALPFVVHALRRLRLDAAATLPRHSITALLGLGGVGVALGYNRLLTGSALRFPYQAFSPLDGLGFGQRALLDHGVVYDLELAFESAWIALSTYVLRWSVAAPLGVILAAAGLVLVLGRGRDVDPRQLTIAGLVLTIPVGQLSFWGTYNAIGNLDSPGLGLVGHLGPFYHLGIVVPTVTFAAVALVRGWDWLRPRLARPEGEGTRAAAMVAAVLLAGLGGWATVAAVADPVAQNRAVTDAYETAYEPVEAADFDRGLVFLPTPNGDWLAHPFQYLRNGPDFEGPVVYAQDRRVFAVLDAFPDRTPYRYAYHGDWLPVDRNHVRPTLRRLSHVEGREVRLETVAGLPPGTEAVSATLHTPAGQRVSVPLAPENGSVTLQTTLEDGGLRLEGPGVEGSDSLRLGKNGTVALTIHVGTGGLDSFEYELGLPVRASDGTVEAISPRWRLCRDVEQCGEESAYVPGVHPPGVRLETTLSTGG